MKNHVEVSFCCLKLIKNSILTNTWRGKRIVDFCFNLRIDGLITNWYYSNRCIRNCSVHLSYLMITLKILNWVIDSTSTYIFLHVNIQVILSICILVMVVILMVSYCVVQLYNRIIYQCNTLFFYPKYLKQHPKYQLDQVIFTHWLSDWFFRLNILVVSIDFGKQI